MMRRSDRARRRCAPTLSPLEDRSLPSTAPLGVNVSYNIYYGSTNRAYTDVRNLFRSWYDPAQGGASSATLPQTADGYPLVPARTVAYLWAYPSGSYQFSYEGKASLSFQRQGRLDGPIVTGPDGVSRGTMAYTAGNDIVFMDVKDLDPSDPFRNLKIMAPGYPEATDQLYTDEYIQRLQPFTTLRFMDWAGTNHHVEVEWSDRVSPTQFAQAMDAVGTSWENVIELANETGKDAWINVPDQASDDYVTQLARLFRDRLHPGAKVYVEYSNEVWNNSFAQHSRVVANGRANPLITATDNYTISAQQSALRMKRIGEIFRAEFGAKADRVQPVLAAWAAVSDWGGRGLALINSLYGDPSRYFSALAVAPYVDMNSAYDTPGLTLDGLFAALDTSLKDNMAVWARSNVAMATRYGLPLLAYEGGQSLSSPTGKNTDLKIAAQADPRMGRLYDRMLDTWDQAGGGLFMHFNHIEPYSKWGSWGLLQSMNDAGSPKWDTLMRRILPAGDLSLDGAVTYEDFARLKANYYSSDRFWQDGDFDGDGVVDLKDLDALRGAIGALTPAQAAEVAILGAPGYADQGRAITLDAGGKTGSMTYTWTVSLNGIAVASGRRAPGTSTAFEFTPTAAGTYVVFLSVDDGRGGSASASTAVEVVAPLMTPTADDVAGAGFSATGPWLAFASPAALGGSYRMAEPGTSAVATWTLPVEPGRYRVLASWVPKFNRAPDAAYAIADAGGALGTAVVDQRNAPASLTVDGVPYQDLGAFAVAGSALTVRLPARPSGTVTADSIRLERLDDAAGPADVVKADDVAGAGFSATGPWLAFASPAALGGSYRMAEPGTSAVATWTLPVEPGRYRVLASWVPKFNRAPDAAYAIADAGGALGTAVVDQRNAPASLTVDGVPYQDLGAFAVAGSALTVRLPARPSGTVTADSIRLERLDGRSGASAGPAVLAGDDTSSSFRSTGTWSRATAGGSGGSYLAAAAGSAATATWTIPLAPGRYRLLATWVPTTTRSAAAVYAFSDGATTLGSLTVDQRVAPSGPLDLVDAGVAWQALGGTYLVSSGALTVRLSTSAAGSLAADGIRAERVIDVPSSSRETDDGGADFVASGGWTSYASTSSVGGSYRMAEPNSGAAASWAFAVTPGRYRVLVTWSAKSTRAPDATYAVVDGGVVLGVPAVDQRVAPAGKTISGVAWKPLDGIYTVSGSTLYVRLNARGTGSVSADAVRIERLPDATPPSEPAPRPWLQIADNTSGAGQVSLGSWKTFAGTGLRGTLAMADPGSSAVATWTFAVTPGLYRVSTSYQPFSNASDASPFAVLNDGALLGEVFVNQATGGVSRSDADGRTWQDLGGPYHVTGTSLTVRLTSSPRGRVVADAIRLERIGPA